MENRLRLIFYREATGQAPFVEWFRELQDQARDKVLVRLERLASLGHALRRPEADYLRDGIYELRASTRGRHFRVLYFFHGKAAAIVSHGLVKEREVPEREINLAIRRKALFEADPATHTLERIGRRGE